jgi:hypothetical protein
VATVPAIDAEVSVRGEEHRIGERFGHPHEAGVGETHRHVGVLLKEPQERPHVRTEVESEDHGLAAEKRAESGTARRPDQVKGLREDSFAGPPRGRVARRLGHRPVVMTVASAQERDEEAGVNEDASDRSRLPSGTLSCERSR